MNTRCRQKCQYELWWEFTYLRNIWLSESNRQLAVMSIFYNQGNSISGTIYMWWFLTLQDEELRRQVGKKRCQKFRWELFPSVLCWYTTQSDLTCVCFSVGWQRYLSVCSVWWLFTEVCRSFNYCRHGASSPISRRCRADTEILGDHSRFHSQGGYELSFIIYLFFFAFKNCLC